ncbi:MAG TPA: pitrilysin family protein [Kofleriaceae bacterium]|nr:pitrilysin family protein [Kofleriaceae bacterium]
MTSPAVPQELVFPDEPFRATQPPPGPPRPFRLPEVQTFTLANGIDVFLVEQHVLPIVSLDLTFDGGSVADPPGKEGLASVCMAMLGEGTADKDKLAFSEALADLASSVSAYAGADTQGISLSSLRQHLDATFALFAEALLRPGFRADDFERMIKRRIAGLEQAKGSPDAIAGRIAGPTLFGANHPYGRVPTEASLAALTLDDCRAYHARQLHPGGARLFVVGDLTPDELRARFAAAPLGAWQGAAPPLPALPPPAPAAARIVFVDVPGASQSQVGFSHFGPPRTAPDHLATSLAGGVFGGSFTSRINMNLREEKGYSYGARGGFQYSRHYGVVAASASVRADATYQALVELQAELVALASGARPATAAEIDREKAGAILGLPSRFASASASLGMFRALVYHGLPLDTWSRYADELARVTPAEVAAAAGRHLDPAAAMYAVVGDGRTPVIARDGGADRPLLRDGAPVTLRAALELLVREGTLGPGGLLVVDADGRPLP